MKIIFSSALLLTCIVGLFSVFSCPKTKADEYGIFLLPDEDSEQLLRTLSTQVQTTFRKQQVPFNAVRNIPHLSLFQGCFDEEVLPPVYNDLNALSQTLSCLTLKINPRLQDTQENIFLTFEKSLEALTLFNQFYKAPIYTRRTPNQLMAQVDAALEKGIDPKSQDLIKTYGLFWGVPGTFNPHVTLIYGSHIHPNLEAALSDLNVPASPLRFNKIGMGRIGVEGNVEEVETFYPLADSSCVTQA